MKYHKIRGVPLNVCTAEQKIAYNIMFAEKDCVLRRMKTVENPADGMQLFRNSIPVLAHKFAADFSRNYPDCRVDIDGVCSALMNGMEKYVLGEKDIAWSYEEIGKMFPALYLEK